MANTINIDANGGTYTANVNFSPSSCGSGSVTFTPQQNWLHANGYTFTIDKNTSGQRTGYIKMSYNGTECPQHMITVEQEGIPCTCDSFRFSDWITEVPQAGLAAGSTIFKCTPTGDCSVDGIVGTITVGSTVHTLTRVSTGNMNLQDSIPPNTSTDSINVVIKASYNGTNCESATRNISQPGTGCGCGTIIVSNSLSITIPREGVGGGVELGQYTKQNSLCSDNDITGTLENGGTTYNLTFSNNKIYLQSDQSIPQNPDSDGRPFAFKLYYKNGECTAFSKTYTQPGTGCACGSLTRVSFDTIPTAGVAAQTVIGTFAAGDCASHFTFVNSTLNLIKDGTNIITTSGVEPTSDPIGETFTVTVLYDGSPCTSTTVTQSGTGCGCGTLHDVTFIDIPSGGVSASENYEIGTYTTDSNVCNYTFAEVNNSFTMRGDNDTGKIIVTSDIPANTGYEPIDFTVIAKYGSDECVRSAITQEGSLKCDCESIGLMVSLRKKTYPNSGTDDWFLVASGNTYGCGSLSGFSNSALLAIDEGNSRVRVVQDPNDEYKFNFYIKVLPNPNGESGDDRSGGINLYFKKKGEEIYQDCNHPLEIYQTANYCDCDNFPDIKLYDTYNRMTEIPASGFTNQKVAYMESSAYVYKCHSIKVNSFGIPSWIHPEGIIRTAFTDDYRDIAYFTIDANPNDEPRSHRIYFNRIIDADENGKGGDSCQTPGYIDITQKGNACTCNDTGFDCFGINSFYPRHIKPLQTEDVLSYVLNCGQLAYSFPNGKPSWVTDIRIDNDEKKVYISFQENRDVDRSVQITFNVLLNGRVCATCTLTFEQPAIHCDDCEAVLNYIKLYNTSDYCSSANERSVAYLDYDYNTCGSLSATTESPYVTNMIIKNYPVTERHVVVVNLEDNETDENRDISFNVFLVDEHGDITPNASCVKTATICQEPKKEPACKCTAATLSVTDKVAELVGGTQGEIKIAKATLGKRYDWYTLDCLKIIPSTSHMVTPANPNGEYTSIRIDDNTGDIYVTVADRIVGTTKHTTKIDISVHDMSTGEEITCDTLSTNFTIDVIPNVPENENQEDNP